MARFVELREESAAVNDIIPRWSVVRVVRGRRVRLRLFARGPTCVVATQTALDALARLSFLAAGTFVLLGSGRSRVFAGSATWNLDPTSNVWNTNSNWTPATGYPNGPADTATFGLSNTASISLSAPFASTQVAEI